MDQPELSIRTDDVARRIEYVTHGKWTTTEYKQVVSILRFYRHQSISAMIDRATDDETSREEKGPLKDGQEESH